MHQPQVQVLIGLLVGGCAEPPSPPPKSPPIVEAAPAPASLRWRILGRMGPVRSTLPSPLPFEGGEALMARCAGVLPCSAERWERQDGRQMDLLRVGDQVLAADGAFSWPARWRRLNGDLAACAGDPLALPPAGDPGALRVLIEEPSGPWWEVSWSGENRCGLAGSLRLRADAETVDATAVTVEGLRWGAGGRERAAALNGR